jgi:hypothetical protein
MSKKTAWIIAAAATGALCAQTAWAGRPLQTEDAGVLDRAACEFESMGARERIAGQAAGREGVFGLGCGLGWRSQFGAWSARAGEAGSREQAAGFGGKTGLWMGGEDGPALTLAWGVAGLRAADTNRWRQNERGANVVLTLPAGPGSVHLNLSHTRERVEAAPGRRLTGWNIAYEHRALGLAGGLALAPMAEVFGDDRGSAWASVAVRATLVQERLFVDASWGRQWQVETNDGRATLATVGFKLAF